MALGAKRATVVLHTRPAASPDKVHLASLVDAEKVS
jgi:hypothetical protein